MMRRMFLATLALLAGVALGRSEEPPARTPDAEATRAAEATELARREARRYRIELEGDSKRALTFEPKALLQWSNPVAGTIHGSVFVWTDRGRPAVVSSIYKWYSPNHHLGVELHALTPGLLTGERDGRSVWTPTRPGIELKPIPGAPTPAASPAARLRQIRALAKDFTAVETTRKDVVRELRLLTQPIYRYESTDPEVIDGALFAFVEGTDPEIILLIEARRTAQGPRWQFAAARMNSVSLKVKHKGAEAWTAPTIPWEQARSHREPYTLFIYDPDPGIPGDGDTR